MGSATSDPDISLLKKPTIAIDGIFFQLYKTGIARVWHSLLQEWAQCNFAHHLLVLDRNEAVPKVPNIRYRWFPAYAYENREHDRQLLQQICDEEGVDLFISTYFTAPESTPSVFMAHDMIPEALGAALEVPEWQEKHHCIQQAAAYIAVSQNTAKDLVRFFPAIAPDSITVANPGVASHFSPASHEAIQQFKVKYGISKPYFLLTAVNKNYKNNILFFAAFSQLASRQGFEIVCIGGDNSLNPELRQFTGGCVVHLLSLSDEELVIAYSGAIALVYPSLYEGFGLPVLEAMACGCPVITCPNASLPEVGGEAVLYVRDNDVMGMADALCEVQKPSLRKALIDAGLARSQQFSWRHMAEQVQTALVNATLLSLPLRQMNLIAFPNWQQSEADLIHDLESTLQFALKHPDRGQMTLLIYTKNEVSEAASLTLSDITMNLLMAEELGEDDLPEISLVSELGEIQWQALLPRIHGRVALKHEDKRAIAQVGAETLPERSLY